MLAWYDARGRSLPFRATRDPYAVLVSEAMAQQTQIARVGPAWAAFLARFPTVEALAAASPADVLRAWAGLGYNRRALNLRLAARAIVERHGGRVPSGLGPLEALPGVGPYTARAVASIAFGARVGAVDTNVRRVLGRVVAGDPAALAPAALQAVADALAPEARPGDWTHALMDIGATHCRARPSCEGCPARAWCRFAAAGEDVRNATGLSPRRSTAPAFPTTTRWLRGRIVDLLRDAPVGAWVRVDGPIGAHQPADVAAMLGRLTTEGLAERHPDDAGLARLPDG